MEGSAGSTLPPDSAPAPRPEDHAARLVEVARLSAEYVQSWTLLLASEAGLAKVNLVRLLVVGLLFPAVAFAAVVAIDGFATALLQRWLDSWILSVGIVAAANVLIVLAMLWMLRSWWRTLSLPRSRAALNDLLARP
jgi:protein-S-isoprenylcysteine O-methyltransferase Ste14